MKYLSLYNRKYVLAFVMVVIILSGCSKNNGTDPTPDPPAEQGPILIEKAIVTNESNDGSLYIDTVSYTYDDAYRVTSRSSSHSGLTEQYAYTAGKLISIRQTGTNGSEEKLNRAVYSANGDTILLDVNTYVGGEIDTFQLTYIFANNMQTETWTYLHFIEGSSMDPLLQKLRWHYNSYGDLFRSTMQTLYDAGEVDWYTVRSWDDKKNPRTGHPAINAFALITYAPAESSSMHNPTSYVNGSVVYDVEMTYNDEGYPLTYKFKDKNYISTRLIYNR